MLVLTRKLREQITIGEEITITVVRIKGSTVQIGIEAPRSIRVIRGELPHTSAEQAVAGNRQANEHHAIRRAELAERESRRPASRRTGGLAPLVQRVSERCRVPDAPTLDEALCSPARVVG